MKRITLGVLLMAVVCAWSYGQEITGQIRGIVTDASGAVISGATVTVTSVDRNQIIRTLQTNSAGEYVAPFLPVGRYSVTVEVKGFKKFVKNDIDLNVSDRLTVDATLQTGTLSETVSVEYDYIFEWAFCEDGAIRIAVGASGIEQMKGVKSRTVGDDPDHMTGPTATWSGSMSPP